METNTTVITPKQFTNGNVQQLEPPPEYGGKEIKLQKLEPWPEPVGGEVIDEYQEALRKFVFITDAEKLLCPLWAVHANCYNIFKKTPRLIITAGDYGCGKSTLTQILQASVNNSRLDTENSPAGFFTLSQNGGAFFLDQADKWLTGRGEAKQALLNTLESGFDRNGSATRVDMSDGRKLKEFPTHAAVAISGKGLSAKKLGNALMQRSHVIAMRKALKGDVQEEFDDRYHVSLFNVLGRKLLRLCIDNKDVFITYKRRGKYPLPDHLPFGRESDIWEPFFAIAVALGGNWYDKVCGLVEDEPQKLDEGGAAVVWMATRDIVNKLRASGYKEDFLPAAEYATGLADWEDENGIRPFAYYHNTFSVDKRRIQANDIRNFLRPYGIKSIQNRTSTGQNRRGFLIIELMDAVDRHLNDGSCSGVADVAVLPAYRPGEDWQEAMEVHP